MAAFVGGLAKGNVRIYLSFSLPVPTLGLVIFSHFLTAHWHGIYNGKQLRR